MILSHWPPFLQKKIGLSPSCLVQELITPKAAPNFHENVSFEAFCINFLLDFFFIQLTTFYLNFDDVLDGSRVVPLISSTGGPIVGEKNKMLHISNKENFFVGYIYP